MRECGECTACCTWLMGDAYGHSFGNGESCKFLCETGCGIHRVRPKICENYYCAWAQELIDEDLRPDKCGLLVSVENKENKQYLKILEIEKNKINKHMVKYFRNWGKKMNTPIIYIQK